MKAWSKVKGRSACQALDSYPYLSTTRILNLSFLFLPGLFSYRLTLLSRTKTKSVPQKNSLGSPKEKESLSPPCLSRPHRAQCSHRNLWSILCIFCHIDRQSVTDSLCSGTMHHVWCITETYNKCFVYAKIFKNINLINLWIFKCWYCGFTCAELSHRYSISFWAKCNIFFFSHLWTPKVITHCCWSTSASQQSHSAL